MIVEKLSNPEISKLRFAEALEFLKTCDGLEKGRYELAGGAYALVQEYVSRAEDEVRWEAHRKYIDIQYIISGAERIGFAFTENLRGTDVYDPAKDVLKADNAQDASFVSLRAGQFAVFFPSDGHKPGVSDGEPCAVKKVVVKIPV